MGESTRPVVWKFELRAWTIFQDVPKGAEILSAGAQGLGEHIVVWARCDPNAPKVSRALFAHPTGTPIGTAMRDAAFVGTVQLRDDLVFHVFDGGEEAVDA